MIDFYEKTASERKKLEDKITFVLNLEINHEFKGLFFNLIITRGIQHPEKYRKEFLEIYILRNKKLLKFLNSKKLIGLKKLAIVAKELTEEEQFEYYSLLKSKDINKSEKFWEEHIGQYEETRATLT